ncbi:MAG: hypothetical protein ABRQ37_21830, partial [Candidatus Eremiobacterota bacterium]
MTKLPSNLHSCEEEQVSRKKDIIFSIFSIIVSIASLVLIFFLITYICHPVSELVPDIFAANIKDFSPEPLERLFFITGVICSPLLLFLWFFLFKRILNLPDDRICKIYKFIVYICLFLITILCLADFITIRYYYEICLISDQWILFILLSFLLSYILIYRNFKSLYLDYFLNSICYFFILFSIPNALYNIHTFRENRWNDTIFGYHFGTVFYSIVQVYNGKAILVDFSHQYGLYAHFLEPIFRITGLSALKFTALMGILIAFSFFLLYKFLREITETKFIASLGFLSIFFCCSLLAEFFKIKFLDSSYDPFFQYYPLRVIFPVLSIYITWKYFNKEGFFLYYSSFIIYSIAVLWNFDTGSVVFLSWLLILIYKELREN